jgi:UDP:flavonoid glycosyltransferase YjiC (YdhE family)
MNILFAWELGGGMGHVNRIAPLVDELDKLGHRSAVASRNVVSAALAMAKTRATILQAPINLDESRQLPPSASYPEVLLRVGYGDAERLRALVRAWQAVLRLTRAEAVVADHAPTALLAAHLAGIPAAAFGSGFCVPPAIEPLPALPSLGRPSTARLRASEERVLRNLKAVCGALGGRPLQRIADLFPPSRSFICSYRELDHYGAREGVRYWGLLEPPPSGNVLPIWPTGPEPKVFGYLHHGYRQFVGLVRQLKEARLTSLIVSPGIENDVARSLESDRLKISRQPVDLTKVAQEASVLINHSSHATVARMLLEGKPMILLPAYVEQTVLALRLAQQGLGIMMNPDPTHHRYSAAIERLIADHALETKARGFSARYAGTGSPAPRLASAILSGLDLPCSQD